MTDNMESDNATNIPTGRIETLAQLKQTTETLLAKEPPTTQARRQQHINRINLLLGQLCQFVYTSDVEEIEDKLISRLESIQASAKQRAVDTDDTASISSQSSGLLEGFDLPFVIDAQMEQKMRTKVEIWFEIKLVEDTLMGLQHNLGNLQNEEEELKRQMKDLRTQIPMLKTRNDDAVREAFNEWLSKLQEAFSALKKAASALPFASQLSQQTAVKQVVHQSCEHNLSQKLPPRDLPSFSGRFSDWPSFQDDLNTLLDNNYYTKQNRYQRLYSALQDEFHRDLIEEFRPTHDLVGAAQALKKHFENPALLLRSARQMAAKVNRLERKIGIPPTPEQWREFYAQIVKIKAQLEACQADPSTRQEIVEILFDKLPNTHKSILTARPLVDMNGFVEYVHSSWHTSIGYNSRTIPLEESGHSKGQHGRGRSMQMAAMSTITDYRAGCVFCGTNTHKSEDCNSFRDPKKRQQRLTRMNICKKCLTQPKPHEGCTAPACARCGRTNHHTLICFARPLRNHAQPSQQANHGQQPVANLPAPISVHRPQSAPSGSVQAPGPSNAYGQLGANVNLAAMRVTRMTAEQRERYRGIPVRQVMWLYARIGERRRLCRVFVDAGGEPTVILRHVAESIGSDGLMAPPVLFSGPAESMPLRTRCEFTLENEDGSVSLLVQAWTKESLDKVAVAPAPRDLVEEAAAKGIELSDSEPTNIIPDIVIGDEHVGYPQFRILEYREVTPTVVAYRCAFGWSVLGFYKPPRSFYNSEVNMAAITTEPIQPCNVCPVSTLREVFGIEDDDQDCPAEEVSIRYDETQKRYFINLPWASANRPPNNFYNSLCQVKALKEKLKRQGNLDAYDKAIRELISSGQAEKAEQRFCQEGFYLPHHPVIKETAKKTKVRPVFNASSAVKKNWSLNDCLARGKPLNCDLRQSLVNFRTSPVPLVTDIVRAFLQIRVEPGDRDYLRFLWYESLEDDEPTVFRMTSVLFGAVCSPHILGAVLQELFRNHKDKFEALNEANIAVYMDDLFVDVNSPEKIKEAMVQLEKLLAIGSFVLHDWTTIDSIAQANPDLPFQRSETTKCLGLEWHPQSDKLVLQIDAEPPERSTLTRRQAVSHLSRLYDPLDLLLPFKVKFRQLSRKMSQLSSNWDDLLPEELKVVFCQIAEELGSAKVSVPRAAPNPVKLMIFCDASPEAYGAVAYILDEENQFTLLSAKGKLAPAKTQTIPKLELQAAVLGAKLLEQLRKSPRLQGMPCDIFSDSQITLWRIHNERRKFDQYVQPRLNTIRSLSQENVIWRYVETENNPADLATHPMCLDKLLKSKLWWHGPSLEKLDNPEKKFDPSNITVSKLQEFIGCLGTRKPREVQCAAASTEPQEEYQLKPRWHEILEKPYLEALQLVVNMLRAKEVAGSKTMEQRNQKKGNVYDLETYARLKLWRAVQRKLFPGDYLDLTRKRAPRDRRLRNSQVILDEWGVMRTRRRLPKVYPFEVKHPLVLADHPLVRSYIQLEHQRMLHPGINHTFAALVVYIHLFKGKNIIRNLLSHCYDCNLERGLPFEAPQADLPQDRATPAAGPFLATGLDFFGPITTSNNQKVYGLIFSCSRTRAIHLEPVTSMSVGSCVQAIKRFIARRGIPQEVRSDNAPTFRSVNNLLDKLVGLVKEAVKETSIQEMSIKWSFGAPRAPWWGGHYERLIGVVKKRLSHLVWRKNMRLEAIWTILAEVEAIVNSRPLLTVNSDGAVLTPAHFLIGRPMLTVPFAMLAFDDPLMVQYFQWQDLMAEFWCQWSTEYLLTLKNLSKPKQSRTPEIGELVLFEDKPKKRRDWPVAKVVELHPGNDGVVRKVTVQTKDGVNYSRAVQALIPLEATANTPRPPGTLSCPTPE